MPIMITARYRASTYYIIPKVLQKYLLSKENNIPAMSNTPGYWWIKWDTFYYIDKEGREQTIEGEQDEGERKFPAEIEFED